MDIEELQDFLKEYENDIPDNSVKIYFSRRTAKKFITHQPSASNEVQQGIVRTILPYVKQQLASNSLVEYNPVGVMDGEIESISTSAVALVSDFMKSISEENLYLDVDKMRIDKIDFYCVELSKDGKSIFLFRQFQKLKRLRKGYLTRLVSGELMAIETDFLGIDEAVDIIIQDQKMYLLNHISLERIFEYKDEFLAKTNEALGEISGRNVIVNIEQFTEDCCHDIRIAKRFTNIMTKGRLPLFFENYDKVPKIVKELGLDIEFDEEGKMIYREKAQLFHIVNLLSDAYFKSLLTNRTGVVKLEEEI